MAKATERGAERAIFVADALRLIDLEESFDTVLDSVLPRFRRRRRERYVDSLTDGFYGWSLSQLCFSDGRRATGDRAV